MNNLICLLKLNILSKNIISSLNIYVLHVWFSDMIDYGCILFTIDELFYNFYNFDLFSSLLKKNNPIHPNNKNIPINTVV